MKHHRSQRLGFTLVEAVVATSLIAVAGSALLLGVISALGTTNDAEDQAIGAGLAQQMIDEIAGKRYLEPGASPYQTVLGPSAEEQGGQARERFDDIGDYHGLYDKPTDYWGIMQGRDDGRGSTRDPNFQAHPNFFDRWRRQVEVYYVDRNDLSKRLPAGQTSDYRAAEVRVFVEDPVRGFRQVASARRVFAYVPSP